MNGFETAAPRTSLSRHSIDSLAINTSYYEAGANRSRPVLLLHGMSASGDSFRELMAALASDFWLIAPDIPGFGYSENTSPYTVPHLVEWLAAFTAQLQVQPVHILGHSFGGALGLSFALAYPNDVQSLILLAPSVLRPGKYPDWLRHLSKSTLAERALQIGVLASRLMLQRQMRAAFYEPGRFEDELWKRRARDYELARASAAVLRASALHDIRTDLNRIQQRSCIIWGQNDPVLDPDDARRLSDLMPASRTTLHLLPQCGHVPQIEQPDRVMHIVRSFLNGR
ncbi:MAG: alpha/beta fold hydrolase [Chloroflexota bacterium]